MLKQRLIGAAVVIALAVVLIPMVLNTVGQHNIREIPSTPNYVSFNKADNGLNVHRVLPQDNQRVASISLSASKTSPADFAYSGQYNRPPQDTKTAQTSAQITAQKKPAVAAKQQGGFIRERRDVVAKSDPNKTTHRPQSTVYIATRSKRPAPVVTAATKKISRTKRWSVQIASFSRHDNAQLLKTKLARAGFNAYITRKSGQKRKRVYRVRIGPAEDRNKARALLVRLKREVRLNGYITSHHK